MIYLDYSATTPLDPRVLKKMQPFFSRHFANPSSVHTPGQIALKALEDGRYEIADLLNCQAHELIFLSGATEANNLALQGFCKALKIKGDSRNEIITTEIEHDSILEPLHDLEKWGYKVIKLKVNKSGRVSIESLDRLINEKTILVSIGYVNSEIGVVQEISKVGRLIKKINQHRHNEWLKTSTRKRGVKPKPIYFHVDATQAFNFFDCDVQKLHVDLMSLSGHKVYGPKGIGLLYLRNNTPMQALQFGGHQERNLRSGTVNVPSVVGLAEAMKLVQKQRTINNKQISLLRDRLVTGILRSIPGTRLTTDVSVSSPSHANIIFPNVEGEALLSVLDELGVAVSTGSACASGDVDASHVLTALGYSEKLARSAVRFTLGRLTMTSEITTVIERVKKAYHLSKTRAL